jgi:NAD+ diphosphatase
MRIAFHRPENYVPAVQAPEAQVEGLLFVFRGDQLLVELGPPSATPSDDPRVQSRPSWARLPAGRVSAFQTQPLRDLYLGRLGEVHCHAAELPADTPAPPGMAWQGLRTLFSVLDDAHFALAGRAIQFIDWDRNHQFCGRCGTPTVAQANERSRLCPSCRLSAYPRISPAVMALVRREGQVLLGRSPHFPPGMFSALAGFVEPGETLEQCLAREVEEEVGVSVGNIQYFESQPWPFPNSLMIAFVCDWTGGEIRPQEGEIEDAQWFDIFQLPQLPSKISIARRLIDAVVAQMRGAAHRP